LLEGLHAAACDPVCNYSSHIAGKPLVSSVHNEEDSNWQLVKTVERGEPICSVSHIAGLVNAACLMYLQQAHCQSELEVMMVLFHSY